MRGRVGRGLVVRQLAPPHIQQIGQEVVDDLLDAVLVLALYGGLPLDVVDDEGGGVVEDRLVVVFDGEVGLVVGGGCFRRLLLLR